VCPVSSAGPLPVQRKPRPSRPGRAAWPAPFVALDVADLEECPEGLRLTIHRSKTDQGGVGAVVAVCRGSIACHVAAVRNWLAAAITEGPVFRPVGKGGRPLSNRLSLQNVALIVKAYAARLGTIPACFQGKAGVFSRVLRCAGFCS
jgi:hypothetical protein